MARIRRHRRDTVQSPLETYLREINEMALLTADEEKELAHRIARVDDPLSAPALAFALLEGDEAATAEALRKLASRPGPIVRLEALSSARLVAGEDYYLADLVEECAIATNTAAAGGNASLMTIG